MVQPFPYINFKRGEIMGHHHRRNRSQSIQQTNLPQTTNSNPLANMDLTSMLGNLNLDNIDLSKIDLTKVQSIMDKIKLPETTTLNNGATSNSEYDKRMNLLNSLKVLLPANRARTMDSVTKFFQLTKLMNNKRSSTN